MKEKEYVAAIDFGTANSGVVWGPADESICQRFQYVNMRAGQGYAKTRTSFLIKKSIMQTIESHIDRLNVYGISDSTYPDVYYGSDIFNGFNVIKQSHTKDEWVLFDYFKMDLHNETFSDPKIRGKGSGDAEYRLVYVIGVFLRCLKEATLKSINSSTITVKSDEIKWGVTIPTIWNERSKKLMGDAIRFGIGEDYIAILEPEGAACSFTTMVSPQSKPFSIDRGKRYMVIDVGGGTTDIVMQELDGNGRAREVCRADGKAAAGWDIDERFWRLLASKIAGRALSENEAYKRLVEDFRYDKSHFVDWHVMESAWFKVKENQLSPNHEDNRKYSVEVSRSFESWVKGIVGNVVGNVIDDDGQVVFTQRELRDVVCGPIIDSIVNAASEFAEKCGHLDYVFLAGGLSGLGFLQEAIEDFATNRCSGAKAIFEARWTGHHEIPGGSIMRGAAILLVYEHMIQRVSKRNYYFHCGCSVDDFALTKILDALMKDYRNLLSEQECRDKEASFRKKLAKKREADYDIVREDNEINVLRYVPICLKDKPAQKFVLNGLISRRPSGGTDKVTICFFSSENDMSFVFKEDSLFVRSEGEVTVDIPKGKSISVEIDFNEFQQEFFEAKIIRDEKVQNTVKIKPEFRVGY